MNRIGACVATIASLVLCSAAPPAPATPEAWIKAFDAVDLGALKALGDENVEREAFKLRPGETSALIETPQGVVMIRCDNRIPADTKVTLEQVRAKRTPEIIEKKVQQEMQVIFREMRDRAKPQLILRWFGRSEDLVAESQRLMADIPQAGKR